MNGYPINLRKAFSRITIYHFLSFNPDLTIEVRVQRISDDETDKSEPTSNKSGSVKDEEGTRKEQKASKQRQQELKGWRSCDGMHTWQDNKFEREALVDGIGGFTNNWRSGQDCLYHSWRGCSSVLVCQYVPCSITQHSK